MFNFFKEIFGKADADVLPNSFNIVNVAGKLLYLEGHSGLQELSKEMIVVKIKGGCVQICGQQLLLSELSENTIKIVGKICKVEQLEKV